MSGTARTTERRRPRLDDDIEVAVFEQVYEEYADDLYAYACRYLGDRDRAGDVVQEVLLRAWRHPEKLLGSHARPWLFTVARNHMVDLHRANRAVPTADVTDNQAEPSSDDLYDRLVDRWALGEALATLSAEQRAVIDHIYFRGLSTAETARALTIPEGTVKSRTFYAMRQLRAALVAQGVTK